MANKIIERLKKLLAMADTAATNPCEAAIAARMAAKLMQEHNITHADVIETEIKNGTGIITELYGSPRAKWPRWKQHIAVACADLFDCLAQFHCVGGRKDLEVMGYRADVPMVFWLYDYLTEQIERLASDIPRAQKVSYMQGAADTVCKRVRQLMHETKPTGKGLVVVKKDAITKQFGEVRYKTNKQQSSNAIAQAAGMIAGESVNVTKNRVIDT